jgi:hypothetical protein
MACSVYEIHVGDIGTAFEITLMDCDVVVDISTASTKSIVFKKPNKAVVSQTAAFKTDGTDGILQYLSQANDLDQKGTWSIQAIVEFPSGDKWSSDIAKFKVYENL